MRTTNDLLMWHEALTDPYNKGQRGTIEICLQKAVVHQVDTWYFSI